MMTRENNPSRTLTAEQSRSTEQVKPGYKKTAIGIIPEDWEVKKLQSFMDFKNGINASKDDYGSGVSFINVLETITYDSLFDDVIPGSVNISHNQFKNFEVRLGDVLFNRTSETREEIAMASVFLGVKPTVFGGFVIRGRCLDNTFCNDFKKYLFHNHSVRRQIVAKGQGAIRVNIGQEDLRKVIVSIPPLAEQTAIADCLSTWDKGIEKLSALIASKKEQKKGLMQQLLTGTLRVTSASGEKFDGEWKEVRLGKLLEIGNGKDYKHLNEGDIPVYGTGGLMTFVDDYLYDGESVGIGRKGTIDKPRFLSGRFWTVDTLFYTHSFKNTFPKFIYYLFLTINWLKYNEASGVPSLAQKTIKKIKVKIPSLQEQTAIAEILQTVDREIELLEQKLLAMQEQKKGLMQVLLTGEKRLIN